MTEAKVEIKKTIIDFLSISFSKSISTLCGTFSIEISYKSYVKYNIAPNDLISIYLDDKLYFTGFIEYIAFPTGLNASVVILKGRDKTADLIDSDLWDVLQFSGKVQIKQIVEKVAISVGYTIGNNIYDSKTIAVIDEVGIVAENISNFSAKKGDSAFSFIDEIAAHNQVIITTNAEGNILITRAGSSRSTRQIIGSELSKRKYEYDLKDIYNQYYVFSESGASQGDAYQYNRQVVVDSKARPTRQKVINATTSLTSRQCYNRAIWERNRRIAANSRYTAWFSGGKNLAVWYPNQLCYVEDSFAVIAGQPLAKDFLVESVEYNTDLDEGTEITVNLVDPDSFNVRG